MKISSPFIMLQHWHTYSQSLIKASWLKAQHLFGAPFLTLIKLETRKCFIISNMGPPEIWGGKA